MITLLSLRDNLEGHRGGAPKLFGYGFNTYFGRAVEGLVKLFFFLKFQQCT